MTVDLAKCRADRNALQGTLTAWEHQAAEEHAAIEEALGKAGAPHHDERGTLSTAQRIEKLGESLRQAEARSRLILREDGSETHAASFEEAIAGRRQTLTQGIAREAELLKLLRQSQNENTSLGLTVSHARDELRDAGVTNYETLAGGIALLRQRHEVGTLDSTPSYKLHAYLDELGVPQEVPAVTGESVLDRLEWLAERADSYDEALSVLDGDWEALPTRLDRIRRLIGVAFEAGKEVVKLRAAAGSIVLDLSPEMKEFKALADRSVPLGEEALKAAHAFRDADEANENEAWRIADRLPRARRLARLVIKAAEAAEAAGKALEGSRDPQSIDAAASRACDAGAEAGGTFAEKLEEAFEKCPDKDALFRDLAREVMKLAQGSQNPAPAQ